MKSMRFCSLITVLTVMIVSGSVRADAPDWLDLEQWQSSCLELKESMKDNRSVYVTFAEYPEEALDVVAWLLKWDDIDVPVPATEYRTVIVNRAQSDSSILEFIMIAKDGTTLLGLVHSADISAPMEDVFAMASIGGVTTTSGGIEATNELFGGPVSLVDLIELGYHHSPDSLSCKPDQWRREMPIGVALTLKVIEGPTDLDAVYNRVGPHRGWLEIGKRKRGTTVRATVVPPNALVREAYFDFPDPRDEFGFAIGLGPGKIAPDAPEWLGALNTAIAEGTPDAFKALEDSMRRAGLDEASVDSVKRLQTDR